MVLRAGKVDAAAPRKGRGGSRPAQVHGGAGPRPSAHTRHRRSHGGPVAVPPRCLAATAQWPLPPGDPCRPATVWGIVGLPLCGTHPPSPCRGCGQNVGQPALRCCTLFQTTRRTPPGAPVVSQASRAPPTRRPPRSTCAACPAEEGPWRPGCDFSRPTRQPPPTVCLSRAPPGAACQGTVFRCAALSAPQAAHSPPPMVLGDGPAAAIMAKVRRCRGAARQSPPPPPPGETGRPAVAAARACGAPQSPAGRTSHILARRPPEGPLPPSAARRPPSPVGRSKGPLPPSALLCPRRR